MTKNIAQENNEKREKRYMYGHVYLSVIYNGKKLETTLMS